MREGPLRPLLTALLLVPVLASAQLMSDPSAIERMRADVRYLASDELEGREAGTPGERLAAEHIAAEFARLGLKPKGNAASYLQQFLFDAPPEMGPGNHLQIGRRVLKPGVGFHPVSLSRSGAARGKVLKVGHGIHSPELQRDDFADLTLTDRIAAIAIGTPDGTHPHGDLLARYDLRNRVEEAAKRGAVGVVLYDDDPGAEAPGSELGAWVLPASVPVVFLRGDVHRELLIDGNPCVMNVDIRRERCTAYNVVGLLDNGAAGTVVIGAHYDHLGWGEESSLHRGERAIHNGADDNASGTAVLLQLARDLKEMGNARENDHLFIAFSGEEKGLYGSNHWTKNPTVSLERINCMINLDMVGRMDSTGTIAVHGTGTSPSWSVVDSVKAGGLTVRTTVGGIGPSDHTSFYLQGIPAIHLFTGAHPDYHKPSDDEEKINYEGMLRVTRFVEELVTRLDGRDKPVFTRTAEADSMTTPRFKVTLGVVPDYLYHGRGVRIDGITEGRPAANAGLKAGDVVVRIGTVDVPDLMGYMKALGRFNKGDAAKVTVLREGREMMVDVTF